MYETLFIVRTAAGNHYAVVPDAGKHGVNIWFNRLARTIAFDDCSGEYVIFIMHEGKEIHYTGWKPGMTYEFADSENNIIWSNSFPEWDH